MKGHPRAGLERDRSGACLATRLAVAAALLHGAWVLVPRAREPGRAALVLAVAGAFSMGAASWRSRRASRGAPARGSAPGVLPLVLLVALASAQVALAATAWEVADGSLWAAWGVLLATHAAPRLRGSADVPWGLAAGLVASSATLHADPRWSGVAVLWLQLALGWVALALRHGFSPSVWPAASLGTSPRTDVPRGLEPRERRARWALGMRAAAWCAPLLGLLLAAGESAGEWAGEWAGESLARPRARRAEPLAPAPPVRRSANDASDPTAWQFDATSARDWLGQLHGRGAGRHSDQVIARVAVRALDAVAAAEPPSRARSDRRESQLGTLRMGLLPLDVIDEGGLSNPEFGRGVELEDADDGAADGWIQWQAAPAGGNLEFDVRSQPLSIAGLPGEAFLRPLGAYAIRAPDERGALGVRHAANGALVARRPSPQPGRYALRGSLDALRRVAKRGERAVHPDERFLALPAASPQLELLRRFARELGAGASDDRERVERTVAWFQTRCTYSLERAGSAGPRGALDLLDSRRGYCTQFAAAAVLLLRAQGLAARAVAGYASSEREAQSGEFLLRDRHAHAWIEVHFDASGWIDFDPTPSHSSAPMDAPDDAPVDLSAAASSTSEAATLVQPGGSAAGGQPPLDWRAEPSMARGLESAGDTESAAERAPFAVRRTSARVWGALAALLLAASWLGRRRPRDAAVQSERLAPGAGAGYARMLEVLARAGWRPERAETGLEFALRVRRFLGDEGDLFLEATHVHNRARFARRAPTKAERARCSQLEHRLARQVGRRAGAGPGPDGAGGVGGAFEVGRATS